jgi:hypothetical protein
MKDFEYIDTEDQVSYFDMNLSGSLMVLGFPIIAFDRNPKEFPKVGMVFKKTKELEQAVQNYWDGTLLLEPKAFWNAIREIKSRIRMN